MIDWTEKYRPKTIHKIVGNHLQIRKLESWASSWTKESPKQKAVILSGKPGIGKTSAAYAIANDYNWLPIELNASDARNADAINAVATVGATNQTFSDSGDFISTKSGGRKLIIIDEADNLFERSRKSNDGSGKDFGDKDGKKTIVRTVHVTNQPVILIVNDDYQLFKGSGASLRKNCLHLRLYPPKPKEILQLLKHICIREEIKVDAQVLFSISESCEGDIRSAIRDLQSVCMNKEIVTANDADVLGRRDRSQIIFDVLRDIFHTKDRFVIQHNVQMVQEDPRMMLLWVAENLPKSYLSIEDVSSAYNWLSLSDRYLGRTYRRNHYGLWSYACDLSTIGVALSKNYRVQSNRYQFPSWLKQTSKHKHVLSAQQSLIEKIAIYHHCSKRKARSFIFPELRNMLSNDEQLFLTIAKKLQFTDEEAIVLIGKKGKRILGQQKNIPKQQKGKISNQNDEPKDNDANKSKDKDDSLKQQSLTSF